MTKVPVAKMMAIFIYAVPKATSYNLCRYRTSSASVTKQLLHYCIKVIRKYEADCIRTTPPEVCLIFNIIVFLIFLYLSVLDETSHTL